MRSLPLKSIQNIMENAGVERVSESAKEELKILVEKRAKEIASKAVKYSRHAKRNTLLKEDIDLAFEDVR
ncbi:MAG: histone family protein [Candidatus Woesearchaeota archaeon]